MVLILLWENGTLYGDNGERMEKYPVDRTRIYSTGFSNGGALSVALCRDYPQLLCRDGGVWMDGGYAGQGWSACST